MRKTALWMFAAAALALAGCDQGTSGGATDTNGTTDNTVATDVIETTPEEATTPDATVDEDATSVPETIAETTPDAAIEAEAQEALIAVIHGADTKTVDVAKLTTIDVDGTPAVLLSEVVKAAFPDLVLTQVTADFTGAEGYKPGSKANCAGVVPIPGKSLEQGWIDPVTTNLIWDEALAYPGCLHVKLTTEIILADI